MLLRYAFQTDVSIAVIKRKDETFCLANQWPSKPPLTGSYHSVISKILKDSAFFKSALPTQLYVRIGSLLSYDTCMTFLFSLTWEVQANTTIFISPLFIAMPVPSCYALCVLGGNDCALFYELLSNTFWNCSGSAVFFILSLSLSLSLSL